MNDKNMVEDIFGLLKQELNADANCLESPQIVNLIRTFLKINYPLTRYYIKNMKEKASSLLSYQYLSRGHKAQENI